MTLFRFEIPNTNELIELNSFEHYSVVYTKKCGVGTSSVCGEYDTLDEANSKFLELILYFLSLEKEKQNKINKSLQP
jgi:hypothetical protein